MSGSCHLDRVLNVEIGVEYRMIFGLVFSYIAAKHILGRLQGLEKVGWFYYQNQTSQQFVVCFDPAENKKVNKHFNIWRQFQNSTICRNDMMHALEGKNASYFLEINSHCDINQIKTLTLICICNLTQLCFIWNSFMSHLWVF